MLSEKIAKNRAGSYKSRALFVETCRDVDTPLYTLAREDKEVEGKLLPSLYRLYLATNDPTEYKVATTYFCGWKHWEEVAASPMLYPYIAEMRDELRVKLKSFGLEKVIAEAKTGKNKYQAAKYLSDGGWITSKKKEENQKRARDKLRLIDDYSKDLDRISIN